MLKIKIIGDEGLATLNFMNKNMQEADISGKRILEIGPKHGNQTRWFDIHNPKEITLCELPSKTSMINEWKHLIKSPLSINWGYIQEMPHSEFDIIVCAGVLYHNLDQMGILIKIHKMLKDDGFLFLESATSRNEYFQDKSAIEVFHPRRYRDVPTIKFLPSKQALKAMLEICGFKIIAEDGKNPERENYLCQKVSPIDFGYTEVPEKQ